MGGKNGVVGRAQAACTYRWVGGRLRDSQAVRERLCLWLACGQGRHSPQSPFDALAPAPSSEHTLCVPSVHTCFKLVEVIRALVWCLFPICLGVYLLMVKEDKELCSW